MKLLIKCPLCDETFGPIEDLSFPDQLITEDHPAWLGCLDCGAPYLIGIRPRPLTKDEWNSIRQHESEMDAERERMERRR